MEDVMPSLGDFFTELPGKAYDYLGEKRAPVDLGMLANAFSSPFPDDPNMQIIGGIGKAAAAMGQSTIASDKAKEQEAQNKMWKNILLSYLGGGGTGASGGGLGGATRSPIGNQGVPNNLRTSPSRLTDKNLAGPTSMVMKKNADGTYTRTETGRERDITAPTTPAPRGTDLLPF